MKDKGKYFAWVKVVREGDASEGLPCDATTPDCSELAILSGDRPPYVAAVHSLNAGVLAYPPDVHECCDAGVSRLFGNAKLHGEWTIDKTHQGTGRLVFELAQFIGSKDDAVAWLETRAGKQWRRNAKSYALTEFDTSAMRLPAAPEQDDPATQASRSTGAAASPDCPDFKRKDWASRYWRLQQEPTDLFDKRELEDLIGAAKAMLVKPVGTAECSFVEGEVSQKQHARLADIRRQADTTWAMKYVAFDGICPEDKPLTLALIDRLRTGLAQPIFRLKDSFSRGRPWACCKDRELALPKTSDLFPHHPAFPAGHASFCHTLALLLTEIAPRYEDDFKERVKEVAENRVIGGFHWPSDNLAGEAFAKLVVAQLKVSGKLKTQLEAIRAEW